MINSEAMRLGVCYYPEQWPEELWAEDARRMAEIGITRVRIGEFSWSRIEPEPGRLAWDWLDRAVDTLHTAGHGIIMGTPTATPPKWLVDKHPDMIAVDANGHPRKFGSRRHYSFSSAVYFEEARRIVTQMAERYGSHPAIVAWQTDNEYGCHNTVLSYCANATGAFRRWLSGKYSDVAALNAAWGTVFWSQEYRSFNEIDPPNLTVTEPNPAHVLDYRRFASDEVAKFNCMQAEILRAASPGREIVHNFMGFFTDFDHHEIGRDLDVAGWDSYPLGFLEQFWFPESDKLRYARQGHPDIAAFHHDLYRGCSNGRWWVLEQQPGPVNWARYNPAPLRGMVRLWTLEAMAHGAELVSYFRWRQTPFAQEQMHAGLLRPDSSDDIGADEARQSCADIVRLGPLLVAKAPVALIFSYEADWLLRTQPQGASFLYLELVFNAYTALRSLGFDVDIVSPDAILEGYRMIVAPSLPIVTGDLMTKLARFAGPILFGPRSGSKTADFAIAPNLPPGLLQSVLPFRVLRVESLRAGVEMMGDGFAIRRWFEHVDAGGVIVEDAVLGGQPAVLRQGNYRYVAGWPDDALWGRLIERMAEEAGISTVELPRDVRIRSAGNLRFAFNYGPTSVTLDGSGSLDFVLGGPMLPPAGVAVWKSGN
jgi:beta-galactosidase